MLLADSASDRGALYRNPMGNGKTVIREIKTKMDCASTNALGNDCLIRNHALESELLAGNRDRLGCSVGADHSCCVGDRKRKGDIGSGGIPSAIFPDRASGDYSVVGAKGNQTGKSASGLATEGWKPDYGIFLFGPFAGIGKKR